MNKIVIFGIGAIVGAAAGAVITYLCMKDNVKTVNVETAPQDYKDAVRTDPDELRDYYIQQLVDLGYGVMMEDGNLKEIADRIAPYKTLVVEYYDESAPEHEKCEMIEHEGNIAKYRFVKAEVTAAEIIADLSRTGSIKDVSIEEAGIDDIIKAAYEGA